MARLSVAGLLALALAAAANAAAAADGPCRKVAFEGAPFTVCEYHAGAQSIRLKSDVQGRPIGDFAALRRALGRGAWRVAFAMNAGMYDAEQRPLGLFVRNGVIERPLNRTSDLGNFYLKPNGVFWVGQDGAPHIEPTDRYAEAPRDPVWATQSGPLLVDRGALNPQISPSGTSTKLRNAVGVRGQTAVFAISDAPVSFGRLARFLRDSLDCPDALYLDGSVSALWVPSMRREDRALGLGTFVVVSGPEPPA